MTVSTLNNSVTEIGNGSTTLFAVPFKVLDVTHLVVKRLIAATNAVDHIYIGTDYSYSGIGADAGTLTLSGPPLSSTYKLFIERIVPYTQELDLINAGGFYPETVETQLDLMTMGIQQIAAETDDVASRALMVPEGQIAPTYADFSAGFKGDPGGNIMAIGLFTAAAGSLIPIGTNLVRTSGYSSNGAGIADYIYDPAVDSAFVVAHPKWSFKSSDGRGWRLSAEQKVWLEAFGAKGDAIWAQAVGTDDYPAFSAAKEFQDYYRGAPSTNTDYKPAPVVWLGVKAYRSSQTIILDRTANRFYGTGNNLDGYGGSFVIFDSGIAGFVIQCWNNTGTDLTETHTPHTFGTDPRGAQCAHLADFSVASLGGTVGATGQNGVLIHTVCTLERVHAFDFGGNGIALRADVASGTNANACQIISCGAQRCGLNGYYDQGGDVNAGQVMGFQAFSNRQFGLYAGNFLGQFYLYFQCDGNGTTTSGPSWATKGISSYTNYSGHIWYVRPGQHVTASTTTPGTNAGVWVDQGAGSTSLGGNWVSGQTFTSGGGFYAGGVNFGVNNSGRNVFAGYCETNQFTGWSDSNTSCSLPGFAQFMGGSGASIQIANGAIVSPFIGYLGTAANGDVVQNLLGGGNGVIRTFGRGGAGTPWTESLDVNNNVSFAYNGGAGTSPIDLLTGGNHPFSAQMLNGCYIGTAYHNSASAQPSTGSYVQGAFIDNTSKVISGGKVLLGWARLTTGSGHVAGTDWSTIYGTTT